MNLKKAKGIACIISFFSLSLSSCTTGSTISQTEYSNKDQSSRSIIAGKTIKKAVLRSFTGGNL